MRLINSECPKDKLNLSSPCPNEPCALTLDAISHSFPNSDKNTINKLSLCISQGQVCCLIGPSGCGKTTLLRIIAGLEPIKKGRISLFSNTINLNNNISVPTEKRRIGMIFQEASLFPHLSIGDNILIAMKHVSKKKRPPRLEELLIKCGISALRDYFPHQISGGQQQRVALARALAFNPSVLLMDEPFSHIDVTQRANIRDNTLHLLKASKSTVLMVTHDPEEAMYIADFIALMNEDGTIAQYGEPHSLYYKPSSPYVARFFGEVNNINGNVINNTFYSAFGSMKCQNINNGEASLVIRPEALQLIPSNKSTISPGSGQVVAARFQGRTSLIHIASISDNGQPIHLHAKIPGYYLPKVGSYHHISFDHSLAFIFPK